MIKDLLQRIVNHYADRTILSYIDRGIVKKISGSELVADVCGTSVWLQTLPYDRFALVGYNTCECIVTFMASLLAGKTPIMVNPNISLENIRNLCVYSDAELILTERELAEDDFKEADFGIRVESFQTGKRIDNDDIETFLNNRPDNDANTFVLFTSGTTKQSKAVVLTEKSIRIQIQAIEDIGLYNQSVNCLIPVPLYHCFGLAETLRMFAIGKTVCLGRSSRYLINDLKIDRPDTVFVSPSIVQFLLDSHAEIGSVTTVVVGGAPLSEKYLHILKEKKIRAINAYGYTECFGASAYGVAKDYFRLISYTGKFTISETDELLFKSDALMNGYYKMPDATAEVIDRETGVFHTGDIGTVYEDGNIAVYGRDRDMIVLNNGEKVNSLDEDEILSAINGVREAAAIGIHGALSAVIVPEPGADIGCIEEEIRRINKQRSAFNKYTQIIKRDSPLIRNDMGKLQRYKIEKEYENEQ